MLKVVTTKPVGPERQGRAPALLALAGPPSPEVFWTMVSCAANLGRDLVAATAGVRPGGVIATAREAAQIVVAVHQSGAAVVVVPGATSAAIVRRLAAASRRPVLVARSRQRWHVVMAATDLEPRGLPVVAAAAAAAAARGARSIVIHNVAPLWAPTRTGVTPDTTAMTRIERRLRRLGCAAAGTLPVAVPVVGSAVSPERAILDAVVTHDVDLLVVGMRRPAQRMRSRCADRVVSRAPGNVLVVPVTASPRRSPQAVRP